MEDDSGYSLPDLVFLKLQFELSAEEDGHLTGFKGSLLHGALGNSLRRTVCVMNKGQECLSCLVNRHCVYTKIFETIIFDHPPRFLKGMQTSPKPFVLSCLDDKIDFNKGDSLIFDISLIGNSSDYHPYIIYAIQRMAESGLGARRLKFSLKTVFIHEKNNEPKMLYEGAAKSLLLLARPISINHNEHPNNIRNMNLRFVTPTRLKHREHLCMDFTFRMLLFRMIRRTLELAHFYIPDANIDWEFHDLLQAANDIAIRERQLKWVDLHRYSVRQQADMQLGGFMGEVTLEGNLLPFLPILKTAEIIHIGKATTFGLGKVSIVE